MTKKKVTLVIANDENDDWLKKIADGRFKKQDLAAHKKLKDDNAQA